MGKQKELGTTTDLAQGRDDDGGDAVDFRHERFAGGRQRAPTTKDWLLLLLHHELGGSRVARRQASTAAASPHRREQGIHP